MDANPSQTPISFDEFRRLIARALQVAEEKVVPEASFINDLMADSVQLVEMMLNMEEQGVSIPIEAAWDVNTVGDAYRVYTESLVGGDQASAIPTHAS